MSESAETLLKELVEIFESEFTADKTLNWLLEQIEKGNGDYTKSFRFATKTGDILAHTFGKVITTDKLDTSYLPKEIAEFIIPPMLRQNFQIVSNVCEMVQRTLNKKAKIGLKPFKPEENYGRENGIVSEVNNYTNLQQQLQHLQSSSRNYTQSVNDDWVSWNAYKQYDYGLMPKIIRTAVGGCCKWCQEVAGEYDYEKVKNGHNDVFRRHKNCDCLVVYDPADGSKSYQNVWSKAWTNNNPVTIDVDDIKKYNNYNQRLFHKRASFNSVNDPMADVFGPGTISNPDEIKQFMEEAASLGVEIIIGDDERLGYSPGLRPGEPGQIFISNGASYSAWLHEIQHMRDDAAAGWTGFEILSDLEEHQAREERAYKAEIELAFRLNRPDIAEKLLRNMIEEIRKIYGY